MASKQPTFYVPIQRIDEEQRTIHCYGTRGDIKDSYGTFIDLDSAVKCMDDYMEFPALREMHQPIAAGKAVEYEVDDKGIFLSAKVVDDDAWKKVKEEVYRGLSIGASEDYTVRAGENLGRIGSKKWQDGDVIHLSSITEFSLVDSPSNRGCGDMVHRIGGTNMLKKFTAETDIRRYAGEEINDVQSACYALSSIQALLNKEKGESDEPAGAEQITALTAAITALKAFITSEIQEDTSTEPNRDSNYYWSAIGDLCRGEATREDSVTRLSDLGFSPVVELAAQEVERKGASISAENGKKVQAIHDHACDMGARCASSDVKKAAEVSAAGGVIRIIGAVDDASVTRMVALLGAAGMKHEIVEAIERADDLPDLIRIAGAFGIDTEDEDVARALTFDNIIERVAKDRMTLTAEIARLNAIPAAPGGDGKQVLRTVAVPKDEDTGTKAVTRVEDTDEFKNGSSQDQAFLLARAAMQEPLLVQGGMQSARPLAKR